LYKWIKVGSKTAEFEGFSSNETIFGGYSSLSYTSRTECKYMMADHPGAVEDYSKAITLSPNYAPNYSGRGLARTKENFRDKIQD
jgi:hypothetical protein